MGKARKYSPEQIVTLLWQIEVGIANGKPNSGLWSALEGVSLLCWVSFWRTPLWLRHACCALTLILIASALGLQSFGLMRNGTTEGGSH